MPYCPRCAVESDAPTGACPLCGAVLQPAAPAVDGVYPSGLDIIDDQPFSWPEFRRRSLAVLAAFLAVPLLIVYFLDAGDGTLTWSIHTIVPLIVSWFLVAMAAYWYKQPARLLCGVVVATAFMLFGVDAGDRALTWSLNVGAPILAAVLLFVVPVAHMAARPGARRLYALAWALLAVPALCMVIDIVVDRWQGRPAIPTWSLMVAVVCVSVALFLFYVQFRVARVVDLDRIFHV